MVAERPPWYAVGLADKDRRRIVGPLVENQIVVVINAQLMQCTGFQMLRNCGKEGIKDPRRKDEERKLPMDHREVTVVCRRLG